MKAMEVVGKVFLDRVLYCKNSWLPARELVEEALNNRYKVTHEILAQFCLFSIVCFVLIW